MTTRTSQGGNQVPQSYMTPCGGMRAKVLPHEGGEGVVRSLRVS